jgi:hypothetical protein
MVTPAMTTLLFKEGLQFTLSRGAQLATSVRVWLGDNLVIIMSKLGDS